MFSKCVFCFLRSLGLKERSFTNALMFYLEIYCNLRIKTLSNLNRNQTKLVSDKAAKSSKYVYVRFVKNWLNESIEFEQFCYLIVWSAKFSAV